MTEPQWTNRQVFNLVALIVTAILAYYEKIPGWLAFVAFWAIILWPEDRASGN